MDMDGGCCLRRRPRPRITALGDILAGIAVPPFIPAPHEVRNTSNTKGFT